jgi:hypothetical protein
VTDHLTSFFPAGRDRGVTVAVEGFFAFVWFGWRRRPWRPCCQAAPFTVIHPMAYGCLDFNREGQA